MDIEFWEQRWQQNQIGFHLDQANPVLVKYLPELNLLAGSQIFVPLCGKTLDLIWLAKSGYSVTGVECSRIAVESFFREHDLQYQQIENPPLTTFHAGDIRIIQGDFFSLQNNILQDNELVYDRAALIALPEEMRKRYVNKLFELLPAQTAILLITLEYNQSAMPGPPFSVSESEIQKLYSKRFDISKRQQSDVIQEQPQFRKRGLDSILETVYWLKPKI
jgi:thiopurine S-methyltransferase